jgi:hypothetical protein
MRKGMVMNNQILTDASAVRPVAVFQIIPTIKANGRPKLGPADAVWARKFVEALVTICFGSNRRWESDFSLARLRTELPGTAEDYDLAVRIAKHWDWITELSPKSQAAASCRRNDLLRFAQKDRCFRPMKNDLFIERNTEKFVEVFLAEKRKAASGSLGQETNL